MLPSHIRPVDANALRSRRIGNPNRPLTGTDRQGSESAT